MYAENSVSDQAGLSLPLPLKFDVSQTSSSTSQSQRGPDIFIMCLKQTEVKLELKSKVD